MTNNQTNTIYGVAKKKFIKISTTKVQRILNLIRNKTYNETLICLEFIPHKACLYIWKILLNAIANLKQIIKVPNNRLILKEAIVEKGPIKKKLNINARGQTSLKKQRTCHIKLKVGIL